VFYSFEVSRSVITVQREFRAQFRTAGRASKLFFCEYPVLGKIKIGVKKCA
jgi:hypothetical protein